MNELILDKDPIYISISSIVQLEGVELLNNGKEDSDEEYNYRMSSIEGLTINMPFINHKQFLNTLRQGQRYRIRKIVVKVYSEDLLYQKMFSEQPLYLTHMTDEGVSRTWAVHPQPTKFFHSAEVEVDFNLDKNSSLIIPAFIKDTVMRVYLYSQVGKNIN